MSRDLSNSKITHGRADAALAACPHCGEPLSPWQQVLLAVDRALVCKNCWYRIILEGPDDTGSDESDYKSLRED